MGRSAIVCVTDGCRTDQVTLASEASTGATAGSRRGRSKVHLSDTALAIQVITTPVKTVHTQPKNFRLSGMASGFDGGRERRGEGRRRCFDRGIPGDYHVGAIRGGVFSTCGKSIQGGGRRVRRRRVWATLPDNGEGRPVNVSRAFVLSGAHRLLTPWRATGGEDPAVRWSSQRVPETRAAYSNTVITALVSAAHGGGIGRCESAPKRDLPSRGLGAPRCARSTNNHATAAVCVGIVVVRPRLQLHPRFGHRQGRIPQ